jgi:hypothetical protein
MCCTVRLRLRPSAAPTPGLKAARTAGRALRPAPRACSPRTGPQTRYAICAKHQGGVARFINHSCSPNLYVQPLCVGHADRMMCGIGLFAGQPVPAWTELT